MEQPTQLYSPATKSIGQALSSFAPSINSALSKMPKKKIDTQRYANVSNNVKRATNNSVGMYSNSTPATISNASLKSLGSLTTGYGGTTKFEQYHPGIDIANKIGTNIPSFTDGTVVGVATGYKQGDKGYGNSVIVKDKNGNLIRYSHLYGAYVKVGETLRRGQVLGTMGNTGSTYSTSGGTGSHLDLRIKNAAGKYLNPLTYLSS